MGCVCVCDGMRVVSAEHCWRGRDCNDIGGLDGFRNIIVQLIKTHTRKMKIEPLKKQNKQKTVKKGDCTHIGRERERELERFILQGL